MGSMLTMTHSTSETRSPQDSPSLPDQVMLLSSTLALRSPVVQCCHLQDLLGITNGADSLSLDGDCEDDDITEPIAPCTSLTPTQVRVSLILFSVQVEPKQDMRAHFCN